MTTWPPRLSHEGCWLIPHSTGGSQAGTPPGEALGARTAVDSQQPAALGGQVRRAWGLQGAEAVRIWGSWPSRPSTAEASQDPRWCRSLDSAHFMSRGWGSERWAVCPPCQGELPAFQVLRGRPRPPAQTPALQLALPSTPEASGT